MYESFLTKKLGFWSGKDAEMIVNAKKYGKLYPGI